MKYDPSDPRFQIGKGVSIDNEGNLQVGGGFTLYKNIFYEEDTQAKHLQVLALSNNVIVSTYDTYLRVFILNDDDTVRVDEKVLTLLFRLINIVQSPLWCQPWSDASPWRWCYCYHRYELHFPLQSGDQREGRNQRHLGYPSISPCSMS